MLNPFPNKISAWTRGALCLGLLLTAGACGRNRATLPPPTRQQNKTDQVFQTNAEAVKAGVYEQFTDSMALKGQAPAAGVDTGGAAYTPRPGAAPPAGVTMGYRVQLGAFNDQESAESLAARLRGQVGKTCAVYVRYYEPMWKVHAGDCHSKEEAEGLMKRFKNIGYPDAWVVNVGIKP